jgi:hypothetical protein
MSVSPQRQLGWSNISIKRAPQKMASRRMVSYGLKLADWNGAEVRFVPKADSCTAAKWVLFDHLVSAKQERFGNPKPDSFGGSEIHD